MVQLKTLHNTNAWTLLNFRNNNLCCTLVCWVDHFFYGFQIKSLLGTKVEWLYYILQAFNSGDLLRYQELCRVHNSALRAQPALVENEKKLLEKINILCLMEIIFRFIYHRDIFSLVVINLSMETLSM